MSDRELAVEQEIRMEKIELERHLYEEQLAIEEKEGAEAQRIYEGI